jgi:hypothetical protein
VLRRLDSSLIHPSEFAHEIEPDMVLEISIILRREATLQDNVHLCPRCNQINSDNEVYQGWTKWKVSLCSTCLHLKVDPLCCSYYCMGLFQVTDGEGTWDEGHHELRDERMEDDGNGFCHGEAIGVEDGAGRTTSPSSYANSFHISHQTT